MGQPINRNNPDLARQMEMGYGSYGGGGGNTASSMGQMASMVPNPWFQAAGLGLQAVGQLQAGDSAQKAYELQVAAWEAEKERQRRQDEQDRQQKILDNIASGGNYSQGVINNAQSAYGSYARQVGY
jgi:hypothetical protein